MKGMRVLLVIALFLVPAAAFAPLSPNVPTLSDAGLVALAVILIGGGVFALRHWKR